MARLLKPFDYFEPTTVKEAVQILSEYGDEAKVLAGGTDLLVDMKKRETSPKYVVCIRNISDLDYVNFSQEAGLKIGALTTHRQIAESQIIRDRFDLLGTACGKVGTPQVRNMGTIGGNICMGGPSQDSIPSLLVLDAKLKLVSVDGERTVSVDDFFIAPFQTARKPSELLIEIEIPVPPAKALGCYRWFTKMTAVDETLVGVAILLSSDPQNGFCQEIKIGLGSVAPTPLRARRAEEVLRGKKIDDSLLERAAEVASLEANPRCRAEYRCQMTRYLVREAIGRTWRILNGQHLGGEA